MSNQGTSPELTSLIKKLDSLEFKYYALCFALLTSLILAHYNLMYFAKCVIVFFLLIVNLPIFIGLIINTRNTVKSFKDSPVTIKRVKKFKNLKRGYYSFLIILTLFVLSFFNEVLINNKALLVSYKGRISAPAFKSLLKNIPLFGRAFNDYYSSKGFGLEKGAKLNYRMLKKKYAAEGEGNWVLMPPYPYGPYESLLDELEGEPPTAPEASHWMGTDDRGRDVFARLIYGFRISILFALFVVSMSYAIGITIGACLGYFGGKVDILGQRIVEIWSSMPFLYTIMIVASIWEPNFMMLAFILAGFRWMGMSYYVRGEFLREKSRDYVSAAISIGADDKTIIFRHILPNALTPVISFAPFAVVASISSLVSLDFLGFGLPAPTASWGELMGQGLANLTSWWLVLAPFGALFGTLLLISFIGEAVREAFDPKQYARLR